MVVPFFSAPVCAGLPADPARAAFPLCEPSLWLRCRSGRTWWSSFLPETPNFSSEAQVHSAYTHVQHSNRFRRLHCLSSVQINERSLLQVTSLASFTTMSHEGKKKG